MAAINKLEYDGLVAWVEVDGKPSQCYSPIVDPDRRKTNCYIASEESKRFAVNFSASDPKSSLHLRLYLDGKHVSDKFYNIKGTKAARIRISNCWTGDTTIRPFIFAPIDTTDDDEYVEQALLKDDCANKIGEIKLTVNRIVNLNITHAKIPLSKTGCLQDAEESVPKPSKVHEKTMKAAMTHHQVSYGDKVDVKQKPSADGTVKQKVIRGHTKELLASFTFKYRPLSVILSREKAQLSTLSMASRPSSSPSTKVLASISQEPVVFAPNTSLWGPPLGWDMQSEFPIPPLSLPSPIPPSKLFPLVPPSLEWPLLPSETQNVDLGFEDVEMKHEIVKVEAGNTVNVKIDDDDDDDDGEEILKVLQELQARLLKSRETKKRKRQEAAAAAATVRAVVGKKSNPSSMPGPSPNKKLKREFMTTIFFSPDESKEVIDLTLC